MKCKRSSSKLIIVHLGCVQCSKICLVLFACFMLVSYTNLFLIHSSFGGPLHPALYVSSGFGYQQTSGDCIFPSLQAKMQCPPLWRLKDSGSDVGLLRTLCCKCNHLLHFDRRHNIQLQSVDDSHVKNTGEKVQRQANIFFLQLLIVANKDVY